MFDNTPAQALDVKSKTTTDPFTLEAFVAWLEKQPGETEYCWVDTDACLFANYAKFVGSSYAVVCKLLSESIGEDSGLEPGVKHGVYIGLDHPRTYAAALQRARVLLHASDMADISR